MDSSDKFESPSNDIDRTTNSIEETKAGYIDSKGSPNKDIKDTDKTTLLEGEEVLMNRDTNYMYTKTRWYFGTLIVTNYKVFFIPKDSKMYSECNVTKNFFVMPLGLIVSCEKKLKKKDGPAKVIIQTRDGRRFQFAFWIYNKEILATELVDKISTKAFADNELLTFAYSYKPFKGDYIRYNFTKELERMGITEKSPFRIYEGNKTWDICSWYPKQFVVPKSLNNDDIKEAAKHWNLNRIPALSYYHKANGASLWRSSELFKVLFIFSYRLITLQVILIQNTLEQSLKLLMYLVVQVNNILLNWIY